MSVADDQPSVTLNTSHRDLLTTNEDTYNGCLSSDLATASALLHSAQEFE